MLFLQGDEGTGRLRARPADDYDVGLGRTRVRITPAAVDTGTGRIRARPSTLAEDDFSSAAAAADDGTGRISARPSSAPAGGGTGRLSGRPRRSTTSRQRARSSSMPSPLQLALGFIGTGLGAFDKKAASPGAKSRVLAVSREGQSLMASSQPLRRTTRDGLTFAERAEQSVRQYPKPLGGLLGSKVPRTYRLHAVHTLS